MTEYSALGLFLLVTAIAASTGSLFGPGPWYQSLAKPSWTPPGWAFPLVWAILYVMIAIAGWRAWQAQGIGPLLALWVAQIILNAAWSWIMFGQQRIGWALADAGGMWIAIALFVVLAWPVSRIASTLFMPYLIWVTIAFVLNLRILQMNSGS